MLVEILIFFNITLKITNMYKYSMFKSLKVEKEEIQINFQFSFTKGLLGENSKYILINCVRRV